MGAAPDCANADARSIAARSLRDRVPVLGGCILLPPPPPGGGWCRPLGSYMIPPPPAMGPGLGSTGLTESGSAPRTFDQFEKPNAKCPSNDPGTTLREPAFLARPEDFPYPISPFPAAWSLGKTKSDSLRAFQGKRVTPREISARILFVHVTPHRAIFLFIIGSTSNFRNPSCAHPVSYTHLTLPTIYSV